MEKRLGQVFALFGILLIYMDLWTFISTLHMNMALLV